MTRFHRSRVYPRSAANTARVGYSRLGWRTEAHFVGKRYDWWDYMIEMNGAIALLLFVTFQRFIEFIWDWLNTRRLRAAGAVEFGGLHYPAVILVHAAWLAGLW